MTRDGVVAKRPRRAVRKYKIRGLWRLELACGHTAFSLISETHREGLARFCHSCDRYARILSSTESHFKVSDKESRIPIKHHEAE